MLINNTPLVSVIVPCYKVEQYLPNCIESVIHQTYSNWELILVDDGSPDRTGFICDEYAKREKRIKVIHKANAGVAAARNSAVEIAKGEYATFLDGDDFLHKDFLKDMLDFVFRSKADIVQCGYIRGRANAFPKIKYEKREYVYTPREAFIKDVTKIIVWGKLIKTGILKAIKIPEGRYFEDDFVTWRWYYAANQIAVTNVPYYYYTINDASQMSQHKKKPNLSFIEAYAERINFFRGTREDDLEDCSHRQLCKSLLLLYGNDLLTIEQRSLVLKQYYKSWSILKHSSILSLKLRILFWGFSAFPYIVSKLINIANR